MVKRLRRRPLTAKTGVRVPMEVPISSMLCMDDFFVLMPGACAAGSLLAPRLSAAAGGLQPLRLSKNPKRVREGHSPLAYQSWSAACTATTVLILPCKIASLQFLRPELLAIQAKTGRGGSGGGACSPVHQVVKTFFDNLRGLQPLPSIRAMGGGSIPGGGRSPPAELAAQRHAFSLESCSLSSMRSCATRRAYFPAMDCAEAAAGSSWCMICSPSSRKRNSLFRSNSLIW